MIRIKTPHDIEEMKIAGSLSKAALRISPGRTVDMQGRKRGQMIVAMRWPPKAEPQIKAGLTACFPICTGGFCISSMSG